MKKGESAITFVFSLIFLVILMTIFYSLFLLSSVSKTTYAINQISSGDVNINLINYLRTPFEDEKIQDLIVSSYYNNDYKKLEIETENIFNKIYDKEKCPLWNIKGEIDDDKFFEFESGFDIRKYNRPTPRGNILNLFTQEYLLTKSSSIDLTLPDSSKKAKITLTEGCINE